MAGRVTASYETRLLIGGSELPPMPRSGSSTSPGPRIRKLLVADRGEIAAMDQAAAKDPPALIRSLVKDDLDRCFVSHDAGAWAGWRPAPEAYR